MSVPHGFMPGAVLENIVPGSNDPAIVPVGVLEHIAVSNSPDIRPIFTNGSGLEAHFYVEFDGTIRQYRSIFFEADAQFAGNSFFRGGVRCGFVSVENEGGVPDGGGVLTDAQVASFKRIVLFVKSKADFPLRVCPAWNAPGVGYHSLFTEWNIDHHSCPGAERIKQFRKVIVPWLREASKPVPVPPEPANPLPVPAHDVFHLTAPRWKHEENSQRGIDEAVRDGKLWIDIDNQLDALGNMWATHWTEPCVHDNFADPENKLSRHARMSDMQPCEIERLVTRDGHPPYRIHRSTELVQRALKAGRHVEFEPKSVHFGHKQFAELWASLTPVQRKRVWVKALPQFMPVLKPAHEVGFTTIALSHGATVDAALRPFLDYHRGTIHFKEKP